MWLWKQQWQEAATLLGQEGQRDDVYVMELSWDISEGLLHGRCRFLTAPCACDPRPEESPPPPPGLLLTPLKCVRRWILGVRKLATCSPLLLLQDKKLCKGDLTRTGDKWEKGSLSSLLLVSVSHLQLVEANQKVTGKAGRALQGKSALVDITIKKKVCWS